jgi:hypothetical protein
MDGSIPDTGTSRTRDDTSCYMCRQPATEDYRFTLTWLEKGEEKSMLFCGSTCLKEWVNKHSDEVHLGSLHSIL